MHKNKPDVNFPNVYLDKKGKIFIKYNLGKDPKTGKRIQKKRTRNHAGQPFSSKEEAYTEMFQFIAEDLEAIKKQDEPQGTPTISFKAFVEQKFLPYHKKKVSDLTYKTSLSAFAPITEYFGDKMISEISKDDAEDFRLDLTNPDKLGYKPNTARNVWAKFKEIMTYAITRGFLETVPFGPKQSVKGEKPRTAYWEPKDFNKVFAVMDLAMYDQRWIATAFRTYFFSGLRVSEGLALKWKDVNLKTGIITVHATLQKDDAGNWFAKEGTKTEAGMRDVPVDAKTLQLLKEWKKVQAVSGPDVYVFSRMGDIPMVKSTLSRNLEKYAKLAGVHPITGKGLRHSYGSMISQLVTPNTQALLMGHSDASISLNVYTHVSNDQLMATANLLNKLNDESSDANEDEDNEL
jgi:integrase